MGFMDVWKRISSKTDLNKMNKLAEFLSVTQQFVSKKKRENVFPVEWAFLVAQHYGLSTDWLLTGQEPRCHKEQIKQPAYKFQILDDVEQWLSEVVVKEPYRREWFRASLEDTFPMFKEWRKRKQAERGKNIDTPANDAA